MNEHDDPSDETTPPRAIAMAPAEHREPDGSVDGAGVRPESTAIPATGDDRVDAALTRLGELDTLDVTEHARVYADVHGSLQDTLAEDED